jgi:hypothetical protein
VTKVNRPAVVSLFQGEIEAQQAMNVLRHAGSATTRFAIQCTGGAGIRDQFMDLGLTEREASYYNHEFEACRTVFTGSTN